MLCLSVRCLNIEVDREAQKCAFAHNVPTPPNHVFDFIIRQMRKRWKTFLKITLFGNNWCIHLKNRFKLKPLYPLNKNALERH